jgi:hypothetical protein
MNFLVECALSWTLRGKSLKLCHLIVMGNHIHILAIAYDPEEFVRFYGELMKRLTDSVKRYTGKRHLNIWEKRAMVALVADPAACIERIKYFYLNPARAHLSETIDSYPGVSSWRAFSQCTHEGQKISTKKLPTILMTDISSCIKNLKQTLTESAKERPRLSLSYHPFAWMEVFNLNDSITKIKNSIINAIKLEEESLKIQRAKEHRKVACLSKLRTQQAMAPFTPKKYGRKIFVLSSIKEIRISLIQHIQKLTTQCKALYHKWKKGELPSFWPHGMFQPRAPLLVSLLA